MIAESSPGVLQGVVGGFDGEEATGTREARASAGVLRIEGDAQLPSVPDAFAGAVAGDPTPRRRERPKGLVMMRPQRATVWRGGWSRQS